VIKEHYEAVKTLVPSKFTVYLFDTPANPTFPYVVLWGDPGQYEYDSLGDTPSDLLLNIRATCVGVNYESCLIVLDGVRNALNRARPVVAGRVTHAMRQQPLLFVQPDREVTLPGSNTHPIFAVDEYELRSEPA
jgi:hypothetical protein